MRSRKAKGVLRGRPDSRETFGPNPLEQICPLVTWLTAMMPKGGIRGPMELMTDTGWAAAACRRCLCGLESSPPWTRSRACAAELHEHAADRSPESALGVSQDELGIMAENFHHVFAEPLIQGGVAGRGRLEQGLQGGHGGGPPGESDAWEAARPQRMKQRRRRWQGGWGRARLAQGCSRRRPERVRLGEGKTQGGRGIHGMGNGRSEQVALGRQV